MSPPRCTSENEQDRSTRPAPEAARPGNSGPVLPFRGRFRHSNGSGWLLAVCIAVALILRMTTTETWQECLQHWLPVVFEFDQEVGGSPPATSGRQTAA